VHSPATSDVRVAHAYDNAAALRQTCRIPPTELEGFYQSPRIAVSVIEESGNADKRISFLKSSATATSQTRAAGRVDDEASSDRVSV